MPRLSSMVTCFAVAGLMACTSCSSPPSPDDGLVGIIYKTIHKPETGTMISKQPAAPAPAPIMKYEPVAGQDQGAAATGAIEGMPTYRISPGDIVTVSYFASPSRTLKEYLIDSQDVLSIRVAGQEAYSADVTVRPDGFLSFYMVGELQVRGQTVSQVRSNIAAQVAQVMPSAEVTVMLKESNGLAKEFLTTLKSNTDLGSTRIVQVRHDGMVTFPLVGEVSAMGKTIVELTREIEGRYENVFGGGISVAMNLNSSSDGNIAVLGEVRNPGRYTIVNPVSPFFALAMAGGALDTAKKSQVVVISRRPDGRASWQVVNLDIDSGGPLGPEIALAPQDMLLVPKSGVANLNLFVEQYIRRLLPVPVGASINYNKSFD